MGWSGPELDRSSTGRTPPASVVGAVVRGPTLTLIAALLLDVDPRRFGIWFAASTVAMNGMFAAFWVTVL
ncbi:MAG: hypothetical protein IZT58_02220 [Actinobacteria bacterium]|nr:hypothetical protein [Actinomycetota bacterium]